MAEKSTLPKLFTFDGEARSGKGTIVQAVKDSLRDDLGYKVMLIDAGQVFRCLVVAAKNRKIDVDSPAAIDEFLSDDESAESCVQFVTAVYHMEKIDRDALIYTKRLVQIAQNSVLAHFRKNLKIRCCVSGCAMLRLKVMK